MKRFSLMAALVLASVLVVCCSKQSSPKDDPTGKNEMTISLNVPGAYTKAANDSSLYDVQVLIYNTDEKLYNYHRFTDAELGAKAASISNINAGKYTVYVVANGPDLEADTRTVSIQGLEQIHIVLDKHNDIQNNGFIMSGKSENVVVSTDASASCSVSLKRYASKVRLISVANNAPEALGKITLNCAYLTNVNSEVSFNRGFLPFVDSLWYNKEGRYDVRFPLDSTHFVSETTVQAKDLTFKQFSKEIGHGEKDSVLCSFYAFQNASIYAPNGFAPTLTYAERSVLVVEATVGGVKYYYPVVIDQLAENTQYDVTLMISGYGSADPNKPITKGTMVVNISVNGWNDGSSYKEEI